MGDNKFRVVDGSPKTGVSDNKYHSSSLHDWFRLDTWTDKEGICLICGIDPTDARIDWYGNPTEAGLVENVPIIEQAQLLLEDSSFRETPREQLNQTEKQITALIVRLGDPDFTSDQLTPSSEVYEKDIKLKAAQKHLQQIWSVYSRANDKEIPFGAERPSWYVNWALRRNINIGWLDWAEHNGYLVKKSISSHAKLNKIPATPIKKDPSAKESDRDEENQREIAELRVMAKKIAIKLKHDGIPPKRITVKRVCEDLLKEKFKSGKSFASRWGTFDGMRSHLQNEHHPKKNEGFRKAKSTRGKFNH